MTDGFGSINWWGFTPALDFQEKDINIGLQSLSVSDSEQDELNILMLGAGDCRHILKTLAHSYRHPTRKINFYVLENSLELYARDMLFLGLALEPQHRIGLQDKTEVFLELYGNINVRQQTMEYVEKMAPLYIKMVTDFDYMEKKLPIFDLENLKFKERDMLEGIFKFWRNPDRNVIDLDKAWELRLRKYLGPRYDAIPNVFDWTYSMRLCDKGASIIHTRHYQRWRGQGMAYEIREGTFDVPNKTVASGMVFKHEGERLARRGFWGDIVVSPYITFGIDSEEKSFFKKANNVHTTTSQHVAEYNVISMFHELATKTRYEPPKADEEESKDQPKKATLTEITEEDEEEETKETGESEAQVEDGKNPLDSDYEPMMLGNTKIVFLSLNSATELHKKSKFQKKFNFVYFSNSLVHHLSDGAMSATFADEATVVIETARFMVELKDEQIEEYAKKITGIAVNAGCKVSTPVNTKDDNHAKFTFSRNSS